MRYPADMSMPCGHLGLELDAFGGHLIETPVYGRLVQFEIGNAAPQQSPDFV
ncbi:MAG: hypothetical protein MZU84_02255 [Sphingobacterium sp.]|nr:hypothetical protein [Sphingobacterium sp.]